MTPYPAPAADPEPALVFRELPADDRPEPGELWVRPRDPKDRADRADALLAVRIGTDGFVRGPGPPARVVVKAGGVGPTLDEMLAAAVLARRLAGRPVDGYEPFARYAHVVRRGLRPTDLPPCDALENVYLAVRNEGGGDLGRPGVAEAFRDGWARMLARIDEAVAKRENPLVAPLFRDDPRFAREAAYLRGDEQVYREDVRRGEVWVGRLPGEAGEAAALLLREPRSQAFKDWARADRDTPTGRPYALLAVHWGGGEWVFSTDPKHRIRLTSLAEPLTAAEGRGSADPGRAWYDGRHHDGTLVANPDGGTRLDPAAVTRVALREWFGGRRYHTPGGRVINRRAALLVTAVAAPLGLAGLGWASGLFGSHRGRGTGPVPLVPSSGEPPLEEGVAAWLEAGPDSAVSKEFVAYLHVLAVGVSKYDAKIPKPSMFRDLEAAAKDAENFAAELKRSQGSPFARVNVINLKDEDATQRNILDHLAGLRKEVDKARRNHVSLNLVVVFLAGHGEVDPDHPGRFVFLPHDYDPNRPAAADTGITKEVLQVHLNHFPCPVVLVLDACHGGAYLTRDVKRPDPTVTHQALMGLAQVGKGVFALAACQADQTTRESKDGGYFTQALLGVLRSSKGSGPFVTLDDIQSEVKKKLPGGAEPAYAKDTPIPWEKIPLVRRRSAGH